MYKTVVNGWNGIGSLYSSHFLTANEAIEYAERMMGVLRVEDPDGHTIWTRKIAV